MEISRECSSPYVRVTPKYHTRLQDPEPQVGKRRLSQARHRATLAGLFNNLRETVFPQQENSASKCQVLCKAKNYIQELEQTLENLLKMKEVLNLEDGNPSSLEDVKEEYVKMYFSNPSVVPSSDVLSQNGTTVWYVIQEHEKTSVEETVSQRLTQSPATSSPDLMEFERSSLKMLLMWQQVSLIEMKLKKHPVKAQPSLSVLQIVKRITIVSTCRSSVS